MNKIFTFLLLSTFAFNVYADEKLDKVLEEIQALNKDLKTLEKARQLSCAGSSDPHRFPFRPTFPLYGSTDYTLPTDLNAPRILF